MDTFASTLVGLLVVGKVPQQTICNPTMAEEKEVEAYELNEVGK